MHSYVNNICYYLLFSCRAEIVNICVLLPLFGLTWVLGIFSVDDDSVVFQYLFAILNSLQVF